MPRRAHCGIVPLGGGSDTIHGGQGGGGGVKKGVTHVSHVFINTLLFIDHASSPPGGTGRSFPTQRSKPFDWPWQKSSLSCCTVLCLLPRSLVDIVFNFILLLSTRNEKNGENGVPVHAAFGPPYGNPCINLPTNFFSASQERPRVVQQSAPDGLELARLLQQSPVLLQPRYVGNPEIVRLGGVRARVRSVPLRVRDTGRT